MFDMCSFFSFCRAVDEKGDRNGSCIAKLFQQLDNLVWRPAVGALVGNRAHLTRFGLRFPDTLPSKAFR